MAERMRRMRRSGATAAGFSMLEVVVAIAILGVILAAAGPQMVASVQASSTAKLVSQAKGILQGQLDTMRTLPFRVAPSAGDHRDLLDTYYRDLSAPAAAPDCVGAVETAPPQADWTGYVAAGNTARCSYEPTGIPMYRKVIAPGTEDIPGGFAVVLNTAFVSSGDDPFALAPPAGFDSQVVGKDRPGSSQVGVTATVLYDDHGRWKPVTVYTQIASRISAETRLKLDATARALEIGSSKTNGEVISLTGGQLGLHGSLSTTSEAKANLTAIAGANSVTGRVAGAELSERAPFTNLVTLNAPAGDLVAGCSATCWGATLIPPFILSADNGLPRAGVEGLPGVLNPVQTQLPDNVSRDGFRFKTDNPTLPDVQEPFVSMDGTPPVESILTNLVGGLYNCAFSLTNPLSHLTGSGFINSTDEYDVGDPLSAEACGGGHTDVIRVLPTTLAPDGLVRITARSAARCRVEGFAHTPSTEVSYRAEVEYFRWNPAVIILGVVIVPAFGEYVSAGVITPSTTTDPLENVNMASLVSDTDTLGDYIASWSALTADRVQATAEDNIAEVTIPALVSVQTQPTVVGSPETAISIAVGTAGCRAEDNR